jgi:hypothetical protein
MFNDPGNSDNGSFYIPRLIVKKNLPLYPPFAVTDKKKDIINLKRQAKPHVHIYPINFYSHFMLLTTINIIECMKLWILTTCAIDISVKRLV